jgi:dGTP triphosphohydrolase
LYRIFSDQTNENLRYLYPIDWTEDVDLAVNTTMTNRDPFALKRLARDYIASMTDHFAELQWRRLHLPGEGGLFVSRA